MHPDGTTKNIGESGSCSLACLEADAVPALTCRCLQVKAEITEIVTFLRNPRKFLSMGARSPAGILLVGPPGTRTF